MVCELAFLSTRRNSPKVLCSKLLSLVKIASEMREMFENQCSRIYHNSSLVPKKLFENIACSLKVNGYVPLFPKTPGRSSQFSTSPQVGVYDTSCTVHDEKLVVPTNRVVHLFHTAGVIRCSESVVVDVVVSLLCS